jgi:hypothetical protein
MAAAPPAPPPRAPLVLLGLLSILTVAGPFVIFLVIRGGDRPDWPPDRPAEWWTFGVVVAAVVGLLAACVTAGMWAKTGGRTQRSITADDTDKY